MASTFNVKFSVPDAPAEAHARAANAFAEPALAVGLRLTARGAGELRYGPRVQWPFLITLWHKLNGEKMTVRFEQDESGSTRVFITGAVARGKHSLAADPEHWREPLGASAVVEFADAPACPQR
jgi:hypothetical protein